MASPHFGHHFLQLFKTKRLQWILALNFEARLKALKALEAGPIAAYY